MSTTDWRRLAKQAASVVGTPCYVLTESGIRENLDKLAALETSVPLKHWVSLKSQPVARLARTVAELGLGIDVVSEYELLAALATGVPNSRILVNGAGKQRWLPQYRIENLVVHFDSLAEVRAMASIARDLEWLVGLRCAIPLSAAPPAARGYTQWDQFGMTKDEIRSAIEVLAGAGVIVSGLHFHLQTVPRRVGDYRDAIEHVAQIAEELGLEPDYIDIGGGIPVEGERTKEGMPLAAHFDMDQFRRMLGRIPLALPSVRQVWLENGRFVSGPAGALVVTVLDKKDRDGVTYLICDGGRVNHARISAFEIHEVLLAPLQSGPLRSTVVCGPTCGAVDRLGRWELPGSIQPGDCVIWQGAGAYHIPLETRFSTGLAPVVWFNAKDELEVIRERETAQEWWGQWSVRSKVPMTVTG